MSECRVKRVICITGTGLSAGTLAKSVNVASDQGMHCLLKLQEVKPLPLSGLIQQTTHW